MDEGIVLVPCIKVSILTRPEERVLLHRDNRAAVAVFVSILTRPEERVLPRGRARTLNATSGFQSSPALKSGCYALQVSALQVPAGVESFNPHPP